MNEYFVVYDAAQESVTLWPLVPLGGFVWLGVAILRNRPPIDPCHGAA